MMLWTQWLLGFCRGLGEYRVENTILSGFAPLNWSWEQRDGFDSIPMLQMAQ